MYKVMIVDDEPIIVQGLSRSIAWEKWNCKVAATAHDGLEGKKIIEEIHPDIVFMDICMPEMDGLAMIAAIHSQFPDLEVCVLTGYRDFEYAKEAIRLGVTRFLLKPSNMDELEEAIGKMCGNLKRKGITGDEPKRDPQDEEAAVSMGGIVLDKAAHMVTVDGERIDLSYKEFELLAYFMENAGIALSREKILNSVWNYDYFGDARTIDTHVKKLRAKIGEKGDYIKTIWGMGYKFEAEENGSDK